MKIVLSPGLYKQGVCICAIYLASLTRNDTNVSRDSVASFNFHQIPDDQLVGVDLVFLAVTDHDRLLLRMQLDNCHEST